MFKLFLEFLGTGMVVISAYIVYFIATTLITFIVGLPIGLGIYLINDVVKALFNGV